MSFLYLSRTTFLIVSVIMLSILGVVIRFFRNPVKRPVVTDADGVIAPADGTIVAIEKVHEPEYFEGERMQISIFMSVYNVHKNFFPLSGEVIYHKHHSGNYHRAVLPKSSAENERSSIVIKNSKAEVLLRQVAGALARRVVSYVNVGDQVDQSAELGFIKFGSRVDMYLPLDAKVQVKLGDKTIGSQTLIAKI